METRSKSKRKLNFENVSQPNIHIFFPENSDTDEDNPEKNYKIPKTLFPPGILEGDEEDEYVPNEETESEDEEYFEEDDELDYFEEDYEYLKESDIKLLNELKKTDISLYNKFKAAKDVIKSREISLLEILGAPISDDKRADLVEKYECLCQIPECTDEYIDMRDSLRNKFNRYIFESICIDKIAQAIMSDNVVKAKVTPFNSKTHPSEKEDENTMLRRKLKELECSEENRKVIEEKIEELEEQHKGDERSKIKRWILSALALPFDKLAKPSKKLDVEDKIKEVYEYLDKELYGMKNVKERLMLFLNKKLREPNIKGCNIALIGIPGIGKCLGKDTPVIMYDGTVKMVQDIQVGEQLMGDDSTPRNVLSLARGREKMYKIKQVSGDDYVVNESHILSLKLSSMQSKNKNRNINGQIYKKYDVVDIPLMDYCKLSNGQKHSLKGFKVGVDFPYKKVPFDPYIIGLWLGDGVSKNTGISNQDSPILHYLSRTLPKYDMYLQYHRKYDYSMNVINDKNVCKKYNSSGATNRINPFLEVLRETGMINNKHIPLIYKANSREIRLKVLAGIIDTDGYLGSNCYEIIQKNKQLADDITFMSRSLGFYTTIAVTKKRATNSNSKEYGTYHRICISGKHLDTIPVLCHRKKASPRKQIKDALNTGITIEPLEIDDYYGFEIDGNHRFLLGDFTVTHNTRIAKCLAKCLDIPFAQVSFGGVTGPEFLTGHEYTYVGSRSGEISRCLTRMGSKNGILFCDEFSRCVDKKDIMASLLHITDTSQNFEFRDNYFPELTQDLSKLWFVYSMNDLPSDQAMLDRLEIINVSPYSVQDRKKIAENYLIPKFMKDIGLNDEKLEFPKDAVDRIVQKTGDGEKGVRDLERKINLVIEKSFFFISNKKGTYSYPWYKEMQKNLINEKLVLTPQIVDNVLDNDKDKDNPTFMSMYL